MIARAASSLSDILCDQQGIVFGDTHTHPEIYHYLSRCMKALAESGVKVLFMEAFKDTPVQKEWLTDFNHSSPGSMREELESVLRMNCTATPQLQISDYVELIEAARENSIAIIGIEPECRDPWNRIKSSNEAWKKTIRAYLDKHPDTKYAVFCGQTHTHVANNYFDVNGCDQAEGIDKALGIPCVTFAPHNRNESRLIASTLDDNTYHMAIPTTKLVTMSEKVFSR